MKNSAVLFAGVLCSAVLAAGICQAHAGEALRQTGNAFSEIAKQALPAVVFIDVETTVVETAPRRYYRSPLDEFFGRGFYGFPYPEEQVPSRKYSRQGLGSGFIISPDGYILTNNHVVNNADRITVTLADGRKFDAVLVGTDPKSEVALIKIEDGEELPVLALGDSDALEVGEWVLAAGNPFGLSQTVTAGIVSAKERGDIGIADYANFIQTDAAINPGNSGGPLLNIDGEVVGINTAIYSQTGGYMGIGFAIPINLAVHIKDQLIQHGKVNRSVLGIVIQEVNEDLAQSFGLDNAGGILISQVLAGSAAEEAGLKAGDIILEMDGKRVGRSSSFRNRVASTPPNTQIELHIFREGEYRKIAATTKELGGEGGLSFGEVNGSTLLDKFGATVEPLDRNRAQQLGMDGLEGLLITEVDEGGPAWRAGLKTGNLITGVNRRRVYTVQEFVQALKDAREGRVLLLVSDGQCSRFFIVSLND